VWLDVVPAMALLGVGAGIAFNPLLLAAMNDVPAHESGLASGMVNTSFMMGGAVGLAVLASLAAAKTKASAAGGPLTIDALNTGYHWAFGAGAAFVLLAMVLGWIIFSKASAPTSAASGGHAM
jgi:hypothetical protein